ncbi:MAG: hypothetical protein ACPGU7_03005 [Gammaproteobacteria bacterium]
MAGEIQRIDPKIIADGTVSKDVYALIYAPRKKGRKRFPEGCVTPVDSRMEAELRTEPEKHIYGARVIGPSRSSEGQRLYYLVQWLVDE